jgi:Trp operon repressor
MARLGRESWVKLIEEFSASGLSQREFAEQKQVSLATLQFWIYKLRREVKARFVPVHVVASAASTTRGAESASVEVVTRSGHLLRFGAGVEPRYIAAVLAELG